MEKINTRWQLVKFTTVLKRPDERTRKWRHERVFEGSCKLLLLWCWRKTIHFGSVACEKLHHWDVRRGDPPIQEQPPNNDRGRRRIRIELPKQKLSEIPNLQTVNFEQQGKKLLYWEILTKWGSRLFGKWIHKNTVIEWGALQPDCVFWRLSSQSHKNMILIISIDLFIYQYKDYVDCIKSIINQV